MKQRDVLRQWTILLFFLITVTVNVLANALPINGITTGELSDSFDILFVPAGYVFSIWGVIYLGLGAYAIYQLLPAQRRNPRLRRIGGWFILSAMANSVWILFWHYGLLLWSVVAMLLLLASLIRIYLILDVNNGLVTTAEKWAVHVTFQVYLGWITVATIANISTLLFDAGWNGFGLSDVTWTVVMLFAGLVIALLMTIFRRDIPYLLVLVWAFIGIGIEQADTQLVSLAGFAAAGLVGVMIIWVTLMPTQPEPRLAASSGD